MKLILASKSPRRKEILQREGFTFEIVSFIELLLSITNTMSA